MSIFLEELKRRFSLTKRYCLSTLTDMLVYIIIFIFLYSFAINLNKDTMDIAVSELVIGYLSWFFITTSISYFGNEIYREMSTGTFEQVYITGVNIYYLLFIRFVVNMIQFILIVLPLAMILSLLTGIKYIINLNSILLFIILLLGTIGIAFIIAGLTIRFKNTGQLSFLLSILLLGPSVLNINISSSIMNRVFSFLPLLEAQSLLKESISMGYSIDTLLLLKLSINSVVYLIIGILVFKGLFNESKRLGILYNVVNNRVM